MGLLDVMFVLGGLVGMYEGLLRSKLWVYAVGGYLVFSGLCGLYGAFYKGRVVYRLVK